MEYLQYVYSFPVSTMFHLSFKPCYKWNTFNTGKDLMKVDTVMLSFKPCYKWNTFNTKRFSTRSSIFKVLNLVISGIPSILTKFLFTFCEVLVLNLVISGIPSIRTLAGGLGCFPFGFKPCYKWNTFNTQYKQF